MTNVEKVKTCGHSFCDLNSRTCCFCSDRTKETRKTKYVDGGTYSNVARWVDYCPRCNTFGERYPHFNCSDERHLVYAEEELNRLNNLKIEREKAYESSGSVTNSGSGGSRSLKREMMRQQRKHEFKRQEEIQEIQEIERAKEEARAAKQARRELGKQQRREAFRRQEEEERRFEEIMRRAQEDEERREQNIQTENHCIIRDLKGMGYNMSTIQTTINSLGLNILKDKFSLETFMDSIASFEQRTTESNNLNTTTVQRTRVVNNPIPVTTIDEDAPQTIGNCVICLNRRINSVIIPCGHIALCMDCTVHVQNGNCPICRGNVLQVIQTFFV